MSYRTPDDRLREAETHYEGDACEPDGHRAELARARAQAERQRRANDARRVPRVDVVRARAYSPEPDNETPPESGTAQEEA